MLLPPCCAVFSPFCRGCTFKRRQLRPSARLRHQCLSLRSRLGIQRHCSSRGVPALCHGEVSLYISPFIGPPTSAANAGADDRNSHCDPVMIVAWPDYQPPRRRVQRRRETDETSSSPCLVTDPARMQEKTAIHRDLTPPRGVRSATAAGLNASLSARHCVDGLRQQTLSPAAKFLSPASRGGSCLTG